MTGGTLIETVGTALAAIGREVEGVKNVFDPPPANLESGSLPALYVFTGGATDNEGQFGPHQVQVTRTYRVQVAMLPIGSGNPNTRETQCRPLLYAVKAAYRSHPHLMKLPRVRSARILSDSGIVLLPEWGARFIGFEVRIEVVTLEPRAIAQGE